MKIENFWVLAATYFLIFTLTSGMFVFSLFVQTALILFYFLSRICRLLEENQSTKRR
jgi:hypothetical protein